MSILLEKAFESNSHNQSSTVSDEKTKRKEEPQWSLEEEFLFFEAHTVLGNKWTKYSSIMKDKPTNELKTHFHACVIKSVRRIVNNKFDSELKDIMRSFYACRYLKKLVEKMLNLSSVQPKGLNKKRYKYNPKMLIRNKRLTIEKIDQYSMRLLKEVLFEKEIIKQYLLRFNGGFQLESISLLFSLLIKDKLLTDCMKTISMKDNIALNKDNEGVIQRFISENSLASCSC